MGLLGDIYSASDSLKRRLKGLLSDPVGEVSQSLGILADDLKTRGERNKRIVHNPETLTRKDVSEMLASATNFAPAAIFAGVNAKTADLAKQALADKMLKAGDDPAKVWKDTGWGVGQDGKWRFEIPDNLLSFKQYPKDAMDHPIGMLDDMLQHDQLKAAYPDLFNNYRMGIESHMNSKGGGGFDPRRKYINIDATDQTNAKETAVHELQHAIQNLEGFAEGGSEQMIKRIAQNTDMELKQFQRNLANSYISRNRAAASGGTDPVTGLSQSSIDQNITGLLDMLNDLTVKVDELKGDKFNLYMRLPGEVEARAAEKRLLMNPADRLDSYPLSYEYLDRTTELQGQSLLNYIR